MPDRSRSGCFFLANNGIVHYHVTAGRIILVAVARVLLAVATRNIRMSLKWLCGYDEYTDRLAFVMPCLFCVGD